MAQALAQKIAQRLRRAAHRLGTVDPVPSVSALLERSFSLPQSDPRYANNALTPGAAPLEPSYSELQPEALRFNLLPLGPEASGVDRRDEATREMRRLLNNFNGREALRWLDERSEPWRGFGTGSNLTYGAFFGSSYDQDGLYDFKVYYESGPGQIKSLPMSLFGVVSTALTVMPQLCPLFTTIAAQREIGGQRSNVRPMHNPCVSPICSLWMH